ncbi:MULTISPECIES: SDR family NAD(P)-dependent oxidoreductase [unclassified Microbacterium]|uniref:SDR family NAD(P)-dependent oxidoreductase n=1 Tax=unclassified Microbacterium TaxID=2609290 RepID=UPI000493773A|nr:MULTISPECIES: SDR family NAD(P)-dependent oxidoreductase [unclassified Microbacterium]MEA1264735.1 SDR family NAD(P)-dependent oxidoreductase [Microbacterium sp. STF-2]
MKHLELTGSTTVITGAANGMGADIARLLAARGVHVALIDHDAASLATIAAELQGVRVTTHVVDLRHDEAVFATAADITEAHPRINALITCAGSSMLGDIDQLTMEEMRWLTDVNLWGTVSVTKALLPALRAAPAAHITHLASVYALAAPAGRIPYAVSKFAVRAFSEALRHELEGTSVSVGAVYPAGVRTGIILHGRYAAAIDPEVAARAAAAQAAMYHTEPTDAAARIVRATERRAARTMVGREARLIDVLTRIAPASYWRVMRRPLRAAIDTTTPAT